MSATVDPSWRVKTKPCEFYKKGRCIFGEDRCNFLHIKSDWSLNEETLIEAKDVKAPVVKILPDTPPSAVFGSIRSPPRSPRTASLLLALKDVIGSDDEEYEDDLSYEALSDEEEQEPSLDALEELQNPPAPVQNVDADLNIDGDSLPTDLSQSNDQLSHLDDPFAQDTEHPPPQSPHSGLLSPVDFSDLQLKHLSFLQHSHSQSLSNNNDSHSHHRHQDSGFYDTVGTPGSQWVSPSPMVLSPPRSPALSSTFELLSFPLGSPSSKLAMNAGMGIISPRLSGSFVPKVPASPFLNGSFFPEEDPQEKPAEPDLSLDSPTEYYQEKEREEREHLYLVHNTEQDQKGEQTTRPPQIPLSSHEQYDEFDDNQQELDDEDFTVTGPTSRWDSENRETAVFLGRPPIKQSQSQPDATEAHSSSSAQVVKEQVGNEVEDDVRDALKRSSASPLDYLNTLKKSPLGLELPEFVDAELQGSSSFTHDEDDATAKLAYLADDPEVEEDDDFQAPGENDTLHSLYDVYSDIESDSADSDGGEKELHGTEVETHEPHIVRGTSPRASPAREQATYVAGIVSPLFGTDAAVVSEADVELEEESDEEEVQDAEEEVFIRRGVPITPSRRPSPSSQKKATHIPAEVTSPPTNIVSPASLPLLRAEVEEESVEEEVQDAEEEVFVGRGVPITPSRRSSPSSERKVTHIPSEVTSPPTSIVSPASLSLLRERVFTPPPSNVDSPKSTSLRSTPPVPSSLPSSSPSATAIYSALDQQQSPALKKLTKPDTPPASEELPSLSPSTLTSTSTIQGHIPPVPISQEAVDLNTSPPRSRASLTASAAPSHARKSTGSADHSALDQQQSPGLKKLTKPNTPPASEELPSLSPSSTLTSTSTVQGHVPPVPVSQEAVNLNTSPSHSRASSTASAALSPARKSTGLRPLRLSAIVTNFTPTPVVASPSSSTSSSSRSAHSGSRASVTPMFPAPSSSTLDLSLQNKRNRLSIASVSTSTSSSDFSSSNNALLSSAHSSLLIPEHVRHSFINDSSHIHGYSYDSAPMPAAGARSSWISGIPPSSTALSSAPLIPYEKRNSIHRSSSHAERRRSQIHYIRSDSESERGSGSRSAPLVRPPSWAAGGRGSGDSTGSHLSGSFSSLGTSASRLSRRGSRMGYGEGPLPTPTVFEQNEEELDITLRGNPINSLSPSLSLRRGVRDSQQLQIQVRRQSQLPSASPSPQLQSPTSVSSARSVPLPASSRFSKRSSRALLPHTAPNSAPLSPPVNAATLSHPNTPRPTLLFAIASDDPEEVQRVLERDSVVGSKQSELASVGVNDAIGPQSQSALAFTLANEGLKNKLGIVKVLLGHGADPSKAGLEKDGQSNLAALTDNTEIDAATRYYLSRADAPLTRRIDALMSRSAFRPLARARYKLIGQDRALEQLFRVLSIQSEKISSSPIVVFLCGPSGHGKTLLAHQFGSLLDVPIHTVNMTTLRTPNDLWRSYSISSSEDTAPCTLVEFLANNEGKRCVVVLDEIEKTELKVLWTLLVPWELGRCTFEANSRNIDVRNVVWVGTSNIGNDLVLEHHGSRQRPEEMISREEYVQLMGILRPRVSDQLGASVLSRVSAILPFVPFTIEEQTAIAAEFLQESAADQLVQGLSKEQKEMIVNGALKDFVPSEGARSLYRAVSNLLVDSLDL